MAPQAPVLRISSGGSSPAGFEAFPLVDTRWEDALDAIDSVQPVAVVACDSAGAPPRLIEAVASKIAGIAPYTPLIAVDPSPAADWFSALPFSTRNADASRLQGRLNAALRVRSLHATVLRRSGDAGADALLSPTDPVQDASILLLGRGASLAGLSVAFGERLGVVGAFTIDVAARHLNARDFDGVVIADGFGPRMVDAFLTVLAEDARFRALPVIAVGSAALVSPPADLVNFEGMALPPIDVAMRALPLIRQHAFASRLERALQSLDAGGSLDARSGLLTPVAFDRDFAAAAADAIARGTSLSAARFVLEPSHDRIRHDAARLLGRLMRKVDFATLDVDGSIVAVFIDTDLRSAHAIVRRLASVLKHTPHGTGRDKRVEPMVTLVTLTPQDTPASLRTRLAHVEARAAS